jgi:hypothetical protein
MSHCQRITTNGRTHIVHHPYCPGWISEHLCEFLKELLAAIDHENPYCDPDQS